MDMRDQSRHLQTEEGNSTVTLRKFKDSWSFPAYVRNFKLWEIFVESVSIRLRTAISMRSHVVQRSVEPKHGTSLDHKINNICMFSAGFVCIV